MEGVTFALGLEGPEGWSKPNLAADGRVRHSSQGSPSGKGRETGSTSLHGKFPVVQLAHCSVCDSDL